MFCHLKILVLKVFNTCVRVINYLKIWISLTCVYCERERNIIVRIGSTDYRLVCIGGLTRGKGGLRAGVGG